MNPLILGPVLELGQSLLSRFFPDEKERAKAEADFLRMTFDGDLKQTLAQLEINAREAAHPNIFVSGWRPGVGWIGVVGFAYATLGHPILTWMSTARGWPPPPDLDTEVLTTVLYGLLGIGGLRTLEKVKGVATK